MAVAEHRVLGCMSTEDGGTVELWARKPNGFLHPVEYSIDATAPAAECHAALGYLLKT